MIEVEGPDGTVIEFPDGTSSGTIKGVMSKHYGAPSPSQAGQVNRSAMGDAVPNPTWDEFAVDSVKSLGAGVGRGAIQTAGIGGDIREMLGGLGDMASSQVGQAVRGGVGMMPGFSGMPGSEALQIANNATRPAPNVSQLVTGQQPRAPLEYQGKNDFSLGMGTVGEFASGALGPGGAVRKTAMVLAPALASEGAGKATEGEEYEPYARAAGALVGGVASAGRGGNAARQIAKGAPAGEEVKVATTQMYKSLRAAGIKYDANAYQQFADDLVSRLKADGFRAKQAPKAADAVDYILEHVGGSPDFADFDSMGKTAGKIARDIDPTERGFGGVISEALDDFAANAPVMTTSGLPANQVAPLIKQAREMARRNIISRDIEGMMKDAETYQSGYASGLRNQFSNYLRSKKGKWLTPEERAAFLQSSKGDVGTNLMNMAGRFGVDLGKLGNNATLLPAGGALTAASMLGPVGGAAALVGGTAAKYVGRKMSENLANRAQGVVLAGRDAQKAGSKARQSEAINAIIRRLLESGLASQQIGPMN